MRKFTLFLIVWFPIAVQAYFYHNEIPSAQLKATQEAKLLVVQFSAKWCAPCQIMEENTWPHPDVVAYCTKNCIVSKIDIDDSIGKNYAREYGVKSIPTTIVFNVKGEIVGKYENSFSAVRLISFLQQYDTPQNRTIEAPNPNLQDYLTAYSVRDNLSTAHSLDIFAIPIGIEQEIIDIPAYALVPIVNTIEDDEIHANLNESIVYARSVVNNQPTTSYQLTVPVFRNKNEVAPKKLESKPNKLASAPTFGSRYGVQTGAYSSKESAAIALKILQNKHHLDGTILLPYDKNDPYFRVIIGDYIDKTDADKIANYLRKVGSEAWARAY